MSKISMPYASMDAAIQDKFAKLGGPVDAFRFLSNGYKQTFWRKESNERRQDEQKRALEFYRKHEAEKKGKAERQLGR